MHWHTSLVASSLTSGLFGLIADVAGAAPPITWTFVVFSAISMISLLIRAIYSAYMRRLDHEERMALISKGIAPPPLPPFGKPKNPPSVPKESV